MKAALKWGAGWSFFPLHQPHPRAFSEQCVRCEQEPTTAHSNSWTGKLCISNTFSAEVLACKLWVRGGVSAGEAKAKTLCLKWLFPLPAGQSIRQLQRDAKWPRRNQKKRRQTQTKWHLHPHQRSDYTTQMERPSPINTVVYIWILLLSHSHSVP